MNRLAIVDVDGVVADFEGQLNRALMQKFGRLAYCDRSIYSLEERYANNQVVLSMALQYTADPNFYYPLEPIYEMAEFVGKLSGNFDVMFLSSRPELATAVTARWLKKNVTKRFILRCGVSDKAAFITENGIGVAFLIDDSPAVIESVSDIGVLAICYDQQWNQEVFPRMYIRADGEPMIWWRPDEESTAWKDQ